MDTFPPHALNDNPDVILIPITKGQYAIVDPEDADLANLKWFLNQDRYAMRRPRINGQRPGILMHRVILERKLGRPIRVKMVVDHINGDGLDNRRANLRESTYEQNAFNREGREIRRLIIPDPPSVNYRLDESNPNVVIIPLNQGKSVLIDLVDIDLANFKWTLNCGRYANRRTEKNGKGRHHSMHRIILERKLGRPIAQGMVVDHINGNGLDNCRENLREATQAQNMRNLRLRSDNTSQYKGVSHISSHTWEAEINGRVIGYFDTALDASFAYDKAAIEQYGEFANLNHPLEQILTWIPPARKFGRKSASGYRGVQQLSERRWYAQIKINGQKLYLGAFDTPQEAAQAYDRAALIVYGESATLNFSEKEYENL